MDLNMIEIGEKVIYKGMASNIVERVRAKAKPKLDVNNVRRTTQEVSFVIKIAHGNHKTYWVTASELAPHPKDMCTMNGREYEIVSRIRVKEKIHGAFENSTEFETKSMPVATYIIKNKAGKHQRVACDSVKVQNPGIGAKQVKGGIKTKGQNTGNSKNRKTLPPFVMPRVNVISVGYAREKIGRIEDVKPVVRPLPDAFKQDFPDLLRYMRNNSGSRIGE